MTDLQGQRVPQVIDEETVEPLSHALPVAGEPGGERRRPRPLAVVGAIAEVAQRQQRRLDLALHALFPHGHHHRRAEPWPMTKSIRRQHTVDGRHRIAAVAVQLPQGVS